MGRKNEIKWLEEGEEMILMPKKNIVATSFIRKEDKMELPELPELPSNWRRLTWKEIFDLGRKENERWWIFNAELKNLAEGKWKLKKV